MTECYAAFRCLLVYWVLFGLQILSDARIRVLFSRSNCLHWEDLCPILALISSFQLPLFRCIEILSLNYEVFMC